MTQLTPLNMVNIAAAFGRVISTGYQIDEL